MLLIKDLKINKIYLHLVFKNDALYKADLIKLVKIYPDDGLIRFVKDDDPSYHFNFAFNAFPVNVWENNPDQWVKSITMDPDELIPKELF